MTKHLIIVESPAKARTIQKFLNDDYKVMASMGHVRDLPSKKLGFDPENHFMPQYEIPKDKKKTITELKKAISKDTSIYLATDEDREGESISWHLISALGLEKKPIQRIVFHEVTPGAIQQALEHPRELDQHLVDAQQARRILDRAVGYELSPLLWRKIKPGLSAGRVQSVAVRILVDREREIREFEPEEYWKVRADFEGFHAELSKVDGKAVKIQNEEEANRVTQSISAGECVLKEIDEREASRNPAAPFTTSTLQQEASNKLGFSVKKTMLIAQQLYEGNFEIPDYSGGLITYMRTDSVTLSKEALAMANEVIEKRFGNEFTLEKPRSFRNRIKNAQEAHEAIRPVNLEILPDQVIPHLERDQGRLYGLIWKRTLATQMKAAKIARTTFRINAGEKSEYQFEAKGQQILFPGFLKVYMDSSSDAQSVLGEKDLLLPRVEQGQRLPLKDLNAEQLFTKPPPRYSEASLVKKLESQGIGRPSTFAPTISTIQNRGYVELLEDKRLKPTDMGEVVTDFLTNHFNEIVNLGFTAKIERNFDRIARGEEGWMDMMEGFYHPFHGRIEEKKETVTRDEAVKRRVLGSDPDSGKPVSVSIGRYGPMVQIGTREDVEKPRFASLPKGSSLTEITLEEALECFKLPRTLGENEEGEEIQANIGRFGPYVRIGKEFFSLPKDLGPMDVELDQALEIIREGREAKAKKTLHQFGEIQVLNGRYGPYIKKGKDNYRIPKGTDAETIDEETCLQIIKDNPPTGKRRGRAKKGT